MKKVCKLIFLLILSSKVFAQIPNNDFESWTSISGYQSPIDWDNLNAITNASGIYTCTQGTPGYTGASYLYLMSKNIPGKGVVPGVAVCGKLDTLTYKAKSGFPFSTRPQELTYYMQYMPYDPSDSCNVKVALTKWNTPLSIRDTIAYGETYYSGMAHSWVYRTTNLNYFSGDFPDSAIVIISSSDDLPLEWSYIYIDNIQFTGSVASVENLNNENLIFNIFPNPTNGSFFIEYNLSQSDEVNITITDILGRVIYSIQQEEKTEGFHKNEINIKLKNGIYSVSIKSGNSLSYKKLIKNN